MCRDRFRTETVEDVARSAPHTNKTRPEKNNSNNISCEWIIISQRSFFFGQTKCQICGVYCQQQPLKPDRQRQGLFVKLLTQGNSSSAVNPYMKLTPRCTWGARKFLTLPWQTTASASTGTRNSSTTGLWTDCPWTSPRIKLCSTKTQLKTIHLCLLLLLRGRHSRQHSELSETRFLGQMLVLMQILTNRAES